MNKYDLIRSHTDFIRQLIRETSDDSNITNEQIYKALLDARAMILERRVKKGKELPPEMYQTVCMQICEGDIHDCGDCVPDVGCTVLRTVEDLPESFFSGAKNIMRVSTLIGKEIAPKTEAIARYRQYRKTGKNNYYYILTNNNLAIFNVPNNSLRVIKVTAVFIDPVQAAEISLCKETIEECKNVLNYTFNNRASDNISIYEIVLKILGIQKQQPEDVSNDAASSVPNTEY